MKSNIQAAPGVLARTRQAIFSYMENRVDVHSKVGRDPFIESAEFPWARGLEQNAMVMKEELESVLKNIDTIPCFQDISPDQIRITSDRRWKTFVFYAYGRRFTWNARRCPVTDRMLRTIPGMSTAFFSILLPGKRIPPHRGPYKGVVRFHLPLMVPRDPSSCGISVGGQVRPWYMGQSLFFDDTRIHTAWNDSDEIRAVLFVDVRRPTTFPTSLLNTLYIFMLAFSPLVRSIARRSRLWEDAVQDVQRG